MAKQQHRTPEHRAERKRIDQAQARGETLWCVEPVCVMPTRAIHPDQNADVCHDVTGSFVTGPGHSKCNRREGAARGNRMRKPDGRQQSWVLRAKREMKLCPACMGDYLAWSPDQKTCSRECRSEYAKANRPRRWAKQATLPIEVRYGPSVPIGLTKTKACNDCAAPFTFVVKSGGHPVFCESCKAERIRIANQAERRAAKERAKQDPERWAARQAKRRVQKARARAWKRGYPPGTPLAAT